MIEARLRLERPGFVLDVDLRMRGEGITALFGSSGSGKTTILRCLAGLERAWPARVVVKGETWQDDAHFLPTHRRALGYVFQEASLFPHLSVAGNLRYAQRRAAVARVDLAKAIALLDLAPLLDRAPDGLSGGERQRVAIARALAASPRLLLMDEPLASLDCERKGQLLPYIARLPVELGIPVLYVSHAVEEVMQLADEVVLVEAGRVTAHGALHEVLEDPAADVVTGRFDAGVVLDARVAHHVPEYALSEVEVAGQRLRLPALDREVGGLVRLRVRARDVSIALHPPSETSIRNVLAARVVAIVPEPASAFAEVRLALGSGSSPATHLRARITREAVDALRLAPGQAVYAMVKGVSFDQRALG